jgi:multidrug resistance efflux pump
LRSLKAESIDENDSTNPILAQIKGLKQLLESAKNPAQTQIDFFGSTLTTSNDPIQAQVSRYADELDLLLEKQRQLVKKAPIGGMIGMVKYKAGERVSPFDTILTLHAAAPSFVNGYIHENVYSRVTAGDTVEVRSFADDKHAVRGQVLNVGSRIVDYPMRLRSRQEIPIWGREVIIKIPDENRFLMGEKVLISVLDKKKRWIFPLIPAHMVGK